MTKINYSEWNPVCVKNSKTEICEYHIYYEGGRSRQTITNCIVCALYHREYQVERPYLKDKGFRSNLEYFSDT